MTVKFTWERITWKQSHFSLLHSLDFIAIHGQGAKSDTLEYIYKLKREREMIKDIVRSLPRHIHINDVSIISLWDEKQILISTSFPDPDFIKGFERLGIVNRNIIRKCL